METPSPVCRLCGAAGKLCRSHIIPGFAYREVIDKTVHPRMIVVQANQTENPVNLKQQTGYWEHLLCRACEDKFNRWETYVAQNIFDKPLPGPDAEWPIPVFRGLDYKATKLFLLSVLWRTAVSKLDFFRGIKLGPHEATIAQMLIDEEPGPPQQYGCNVVKLLPQNSIDFSHVVFQPFCIRHDGGENGCLISFLGFVFDFYITTRLTAPGVIASFVNQAGTLPVLPISISSVQPLWKLWMKSHEAAGRT